MLVVGFIAIGLFVVAIAANNVTATDMWSPPMPQEAKVGWLELRLRDWRQLWRF